MLTRTANPCTPVRTRPRPPRYLAECLCENCLQRVAHEARQANKERIRTGTKPGTRPKAKTRRQITRSAWFKRRRAADPGWQLNRNFRAAVWKALRGTKGARWPALVGYSLADLRAHLEGQFLDGMTWENYGRWHIDHIRPLASFQITGPDCEAFKEAWALSNLQPLWQKDNLKKGTKAGTAMGGNG